MCAILLSDVLPVMLPESLPIFCRRYAGAGAEVRWLLQGLFFFRDVRWRFGGAGERQEARGIAVFADFVAGMFAGVAAVAVFSLGTAGVDRSEVGIFLDSGAGTASLCGADAFAVFVDDVAGAMAARDMVEIIAVFAAISM